MSTWKPEDLIAYYEAKAVKHADNEWLCNWYTGKAQYWKDYLAAQKQT